MQKTRKWNLQEVLSIGTEQAFGFWDTGKIRKKC